jgi:ribosomal protein L40E
MAHSLVCWKCGADLSALSLPLSRRDECARCRAELHVCRMCSDFDPHVAKQCREPIAEEVSDKTKANFCDYFAPRPAAYVAPDLTAAEQARRDLEKLFGRSS